MNGLKDRSINIIQQNQTPSGAYIASPNFEQYRYCWLRDGTFIAYAMDLTGRHNSSRRFYNWVHKAVCNQEDRVLHLLYLAGRGISPKPVEMLPTRYHPDGTVEESHEWPSFQLDGYGTWLWGLAEHVNLTKDYKLIEEFEKSIRLTAEYLKNFWMAPNYDCWEEFGDKIHTSTLACIYGGLKSLNTYLADVSIKETCENIKDFVLEKCVINNRLVKFTGTEQVDASLLWVSVPFGLLAPEDEIMLNTVKEIQRKLLHKGGVHRYSEDTYYGGGEWPLLTCWLGWYYCKIGDIDAVKNLLVWVERQATDDGEIAEQILDHVNDPSFIDVWIKRWGEVACPLLWSHAMYLVLLMEINKSYQTEPFVLQNI